MPVANCSKCRRVFQRIQGSLCPICHQESLTQISQVYRFVQSNPEMPLDEIAQQCQITVKELEHMLIEGKLGTAASKMIYQCQRCGQSIPALARRGWFCSTCAHKIEIEGRIYQYHHSPPALTQPGDAEATPESPTTASPGLIDSDIAPSSPPPPPPRRAAKPTAPSPESMPQQEPAGFSGKSYGFKRMHQD